MAFDTTAQDETAGDLAAVENRQFYYDLGRRALYGLVIVSALFFLWSLIRRLERAVAKSSTPAPGAWSACTLHPGSRGCRRRRSVSALGNVRGTGARAP